MSRDLRGDSPDFGLVWFGEMGVYCVGGENFINIVESESFFWGKGETGPNDGFGIDWWDEEGTLAGGDVVGEVGIGKIAAGEVVKVATLSERRLRQYDPYNTMNPTSCE